jgi:hypothetical protein
MSSRFLGFIKKEQFHLLKHSRDEVAEGIILRFTAIAMMVAESLEHSELSLADFEGKAVLIEGEGGASNDGDWIYSSQMIGLIG